MSRLHCLRVIQTVEYLDIPPCRPNGVEVEIGRRDPYPTPSVTVFDDVSRTDETHSRTKDAPLNRSIVEFTKCAVQRHELPGLRSGQRNVDGVPIEFV